MNSGTERPDGWFQDEEDDLDGYTKFSQGKNFLSLATLENRCEAGSISFLHPVFCPDVVWKNDLTDGSLNLWLSWVGRTADENHRGKDFCQREQRRSYLIANSRLNIDKKQCQNEQARLLRDSLCAAGFHFDGLLANRLVENQKQHHYRFLRALLIHGKLSKFIKMMSNQL